MVADKDIFINVLLEVASKFHEAADLESCSQRVRGALLINSSTSPDDCAQADGITYEGDASWQGLTPRGTGVPVSAAIESLAHLSAVPAELQEEEPDLTLEDLQAAVMLTARILRAFECTR